MFKLKKEEPLLNYLVKHSLPGRLRINIRALKFLGEFNSELYTELQKADYIDTIEISNISGNLLVYYDSNIDENNLIKHIKKVISSYSLYAFKQEKKIKNQLTVKERNLNQEPIKDMIRNITLMTGVLIYSSLKRTRLMPQSSLFTKITTPVALTSLYVSQEVFESGYKSLIEDKRPNADTLSTLAIVASLLSGKDISALTVIFLHEIAELLTAYTMRHTRNALRDMLDTGDTHVWRLGEHGTIKVPIEEVNIGDTIVVHTGEKISVDGRVRKGSALIDEASITGEYLPKHKEVDDLVFAGTLNKSGTIEVEVEKVGDNTAISRIITMVEEANDHKATIQTYADKFSAALIPLNLLLAGTVFLTTKNITKALNMLIIDYSCGIRLSTAAAFSASINTAARNGILIKGSNYLELLAESDTLILDKTGTLTMGDPIVNEVVTAKFISENELLALASAAEEQSQHPLALAILNKARDEGIKIPKHEEVKIHVARGVETKVFEDIIRVGNEKFMLEEEVETRHLDREIVKLKDSGATIIFIARNNKLLGMLTIEDPLRDHMKKSVNQMRSLGIDELILLTGDLEPQARYVCKEINLDRYEAELLPEDKAKTVLKLQSEGARVVMIGDGINDGPALAYSDVGLALGSSRTDLAMEAADITITGDNPMMIPAVIRLSQKTMSVIKQNFATAIGINTLGLILGGSGLLPVFWGAVLHNSSTILVVGNSLRLLFVDIEKRR